ncbi:MAG: LamG-like jellyroll fold domain-containing protein, partial [Bacteroidota bacterium]
LFAFNPSGNLLSTTGSILTNNATGLFTDPTLGDYTLAENSPAIDAGDNSVIGSLTTDLLGNPRPVGTADAGAYELPQTVSPGDDPILALALTLDTCSSNTVTNTVTGEAIGSLAGGALRTAGYQNQGIQFDGIDDQLILTDTTLNTGPDNGLSYSFWVYPTRRNERRETLIERVKSPVATVISLEFGEPIVYLGGLDNPYWIRSGNILPLHTWSHLAVTVIEGTARIFVNGALVKQVTGLTGQLNFSPGNHVLGLRGNSTQGFAGKLDEVRIFNYPLPGADVMTEATRLTFSPSVCLPDPVAQYSYSECTGTTTTDSQGTNHGTLVGSSFVGGYLGTGMAFDGNDHVNLGSNPDLEFSTAFTFASWLNTSQTTGRGIIAMDNYNGNNWSYNISILDGRPEISLGTGVTVPFPLRMNTSIADGTWHHVAFTFAQGTVTGYLDGAEVAQWNNLQGAIIPNSSTDVWLGGRAGKNRYYLGSLDETAFYNQALTSLEIASLANLSQNSSSCPSPRPSRETLETTLSNSWEVYPNPSEGAVVLRAEQPFAQGTTLLITNALGQVILSKTVEAGEQELLISELEKATPGLYYLSLISAEDRQVKTLQLR